MRSQLTRKRLHFKIKHLVFFEHNENDTIISQFVVMSESSVCSLSVDVVSLKNNNLMVKKFFFLKLTTYITY